MTTRRTFLIGMAATVGSLALSGCGSPSLSIDPSSDAITFGVSGPFTGDNAEYGVIWKNAFGLTLDEINGKGGIHGRRLQLDYEDSQANPSQSVMIAQKFVTNSNILAELGDLTSAASIAAAPIYQRAQMVQFGFNNSDPKFTQSGNFMFSTAATQQVLSEYMAEQAVTTLRSHTQAILYLDNAYGQSAASFYTRKAKSLGANIVISESYLSTETDFRPLLLRVRATNPDLVTLISFYNDAALLVRQARAVGITAKIFAAGSAYSPRFLSLAGDAANGVVLPAQFFPTDPRTNVQQFVKAYQARYNELPDIFAVGAYDALNILAWAVEKGGATRKGIQQALSTGTNIPSLQYGSFQFGSDRRVSQFTSFLLIVENGQFTRLS